MEVIISTKGQITVPKPLRDAWHLKTGDRLIFEEIAGVGIVLRPRVTDVTSLKGCVAYKGSPLSVDDMNHIIMSKSS
jgi:antitoxin PrlF